MRSGCWINLFACSSEVKDVVDDNISEVADAIVSAYDNGELQAAIEGGHDTWSKWIKAMGKAFKRKVISCYRLLHRS